MGTKKKLFWRPEGHVKTRWKGGGEELEEVSEEEAVGGGGDAASAARQRRHGQGEEDAQIR